jgi:hypothetical protein
MDEMSAFERQLATEVQLAYGPARQVDVNAIVRSATTARARLAIHPIMAGVRFAGAVFLTALLGGIVLIALPAGGPDPDHSRGVVASPSGTPSPTPSADPLSRLVTDELEPGVYRVLDDGADHRLTIDSTEAVRSRFVATGLDGSVWLADGEAEGDPDSRQLFRVGVPGVFAASRLHPHWPTLTVAPDGTVWAIGAGATQWPDPSVGDQLLSHDGEAWTAHDIPDGARASGVHIGADGSVLVDWFEPGASVACVPSNGPPRVGQLGRDGSWDVLPPLPDIVTAAGDRGTLVADDHGRAWLAVGSSAGCPESGGLFHFDGESWRVVPEVPNGPGARVGPMALGPDGTLWVYAEVSRDADAPPGASRSLSRLMGDEWATFGVSEGVPVLVGPEQYGAAMAVAADGTLWLAFEIGAFAVLDVNRGAGGVLDMPVPGGACAGVLSYDGVEWTRYLAGRCASDIAVGVDGSVWVTEDIFSFGGGVKWAGVYRIRPELTAAPSRRQGG